MSEWFMYVLKFDKDGILWAGGVPFSFSKFTEEEGIQELDSHGGEVSNIEIDKDNNLWLASDDGLVKYMKDSYIVFNKDNSSLPHSWIHDVKIDESGIIWLVAGGYLVRFDEENFISYEIPYIDNYYDFIYSLEIDSDGTAWLGSRRSGLIKFKDGVFKQIDVSNSPLLTNDVAFDLDVDPDGNVWLGTWHNLVKIDSNDNWSSYFEDINYDYYQASRVTSARVSPTGDLWIALGRSDTCILRINDTGEKVFTGGPGSYKFFFDKKGNTWISSQTGLYKYDNSTLQRFTPENSPLNSYQINGLAFDKDDNLWGAAMGTDGYEGGVFKYDGTNWTIYTEEKDGLPSSMPIVLKFDSKGILWIHFRDNRNAIGKDLGYGLTRFDGSTWTSYTTQNSGIQSNSILDIEIDKDDNIWLATVGGLTKYDGTNWDVYNTANSGLASDWINGIALDYHRDKIWMVHMLNGGISVANLNSSGVGIESVKQDDSPEGFVIYPNPAKTDINIRFNQDTGAHSLEVFDISGRIMGRRNIAGNTNSVIQLSLSDLNIHRGGMYFVKLTGQTGTYTQRLLVKD
jgi:ligand-binding sensor domain-containing protein